MKVFFNFVCLGFNQLTFDFCLLKLEIFKLCLFFKCSTPNMWEFHCGVCDVPCQSMSLLEKHNGCPKHIARLKKLNMFLPLEPYEFTLLQLSRPSQEISKEAKCLKIIFFYNIYIYIYIYI
jgi:hypothetical protein